VRPAGRTIKKAFRGTPYLEFCTDGRRRDYRGGRKSFFSEMIAERLAEFIFLSLINLIIACVTGAFLRNVDMLFFCAGQNQIT